MPKCFFTGIDIPLQESFLLDISAARHLLRDLRQRVVSLERLIDQLGLKDNVETRDRKTGVKFVRKDRRLVSRSVAEALGSAFPERDVFIEWKAWRARVGSFPSSETQLDNADSPKVNTTP